jgi:serine phosphatase RsbU (regulator of sigma subunit)
MASRFSTPRALVEALHNRDEAARLQLREWLAEPIRRLVQDLHARYQLPHRLERLTSHALHAAETYLRMRSPQDFAQMSEAGFRGSILFQVARQFAQPFGRAGQLAVPEPLPETEGYTCQTVYLPSEKVGTFSFGGDWYGGRREEDGTLWLIVADITGHGFAAYLMANALPAVWLRCWAALRHASPTPGEVLARMHDLLADCLPEDVFVECTLLKLSPDGRATMAPAGGARVLLRRHRPERLDLVKLRGVWLGFERPSGEEHSCLLEVGDELLLGSDGIFDQLIDYGGPGGDLVELVGEAMGRGGLLEAVRAVLERALRDRPQRDDITVVTVRRRPHSGVNGKGDER